MCDETAALLGICNYYLSVVNIVNWKVIIRIIEILRCSFWVSVLYFHALEHFLKNLGYCNFYICKGYN